MIRAPRWRVRSAFAMLALIPAAAAASSVDAVVVRGKSQTVHLYGPSGGAPVVAASGDGGWIHLGPGVAEFLGGRGFFVVGVDSKAYLSSFTEGGRTLTPAEVPGDFLEFVGRARGARTDKVLLLGVSEGAGLSVLAASDPAVRAAVAGVVVLGLPDQNELGWRARDSLIYLTHKVPKEPLFSSADYVPRLGSLPLAALHSTRDEFVPVATIQRLMALPGGPRRLWVIEAQNHRFSGATDEFRRRLLEAIEWIQAGGS